MTLHNIKEERPEFKPGSMRDRQCKILFLHDVEYQIIDGRLMADNDDLTNMSITELKQWLGY